MRWAETGARRANLILIGQYNSPFVRRVGIALTLYGLPFEHRPWSVFGDADKIRAYNPLVRVPTLVLDDGEVLIESHSILDYLDSLVPADRALFPPAEPARHRALKVAALATGLADKAVSLFYERRLHKEVSDVWVDRCRAQIVGRSCRAGSRPRRRVGDYWFGDRIGHADIAVAAALRFLAEVAPGAGFDGGFSGARRARSAARGAAGVSGDRAAVHPADLSANGGALAAATVTKPLPQSSRIRIAGGGWLTSTLRCAHGILSIPCSTSASVLRCWRLGWPCPGAAPNRASSSRTNPGARMRSAPAWPRASCARPASSRRAPRSAGRACAARCSPSRYRRPPTAGCSCSPPPCCAARWCRPSTTGRSASSSRPRATTTASRSSS